MHPWEVNGFGQCPIIKTIATHRNDIENLPLVPEILRGPTVSNFGMEHGGLLQKLYKKNSKTSFVLTRLV